MLLTYIFILFFFGLIVGSFINVCIYRIPRDESILFPRSHCPSCNTVIRWYDNVPILSFLLLRMRCRHCGSRISLQYPLVELCTGLSFLIVGYRFPFTLMLPVYLFVVYVLITVAGIDLQHKIIPDALSLSLVLAGLGTSFLNASLGTLPGQRFLASLTGLAVGGGSLFLIGFLAEKILKKEAMGGGDVKFLAGIGTVMGWERTMITLFVASLMAAGIGLSLIAARRMKRDEYMPFGPFLALAAFITLLLPPWISWTGLLEGH